jgi:outer membrane lipoprotein-sorting protein
MPQNRIVPALAVAVALPLWTYAQNPAPGTPPPAAPGAISTPLPGTPGLPGGPPAAIAPAPAPGAAAPPVAAPPTEAEKTLDEAIAKLKTIQSVSADIKQTVKLLGQTFQIAGTYLRAPDYRLYLLLEVSGLGDSPGTMLQVSDGRVFWEYKKVLDIPGLVKRELPGIIELLKSPDCEPLLREQVLAQLGFSGPEALLVGLREAIAFDQKEAGEFGGRPCWVLRGRWNDRQRLTSPEQPPLPATGPLPPYVPSLAAVWVDQETGWPYQLKLTGKSISVMDLKVQTRELGPDGRPVGRQVAPSNVPPSELTLTYANVKLNPTLGPEQFAFTPPTEQIQIIDETQAIASSLQAAIADRAARRKAEAAKEAPDLPVPIPVPRPAGDAKPASAPPSEPPAVAPPKS